MFFSNSLTRSNDFFPDSKSATLLTSSYEKLKLLQCNYCHICWSWQQYDCPINLQFYALLWEMESHDEHVRENGFLDIRKLFLKWFWSLKAIWQNICQVNSIVSQNIIKIGGKWDFLGEVGFHNEHDREDGCLRDCINPGWRVTFENVCKQVQNRVSKNIKHLEHGFLFPIMNSIWSDFRRSRTW